MARRTKQRGLGAAAIPNMPAKPSDGENALSGMPSPELGSGDHVTPSVLLHISNGKHRLAPQVEAAKAEEMQGHWRHQLKRQLREVYLKY